MISEYMKYKIHQIKEWVKIIPKELNSLNMWKNVFLSLFLITLFLRKFSASAIFFIFGIIFYLISDYNRGEHIHWFRNRYKNKVMKVEGRAANGDTEKDNNRE